MEPKTPDDWFASTVPGKRCKWSLDEILTEALNSNHRPVTKLLCELMTGLHATELRAAMTEFQLETQGDAVAAQLKKAAQ